MTTLWLSALLFATLAQTPVAANNPPIKPRAPIGGIVIRQGTDTAVAGAEVTLKGIVRDDRIGPRGRVLPGPERQVTLTAVADKAGRFSIQAEEGDYAISARHERYSSPTHGAGATTFTLKSQEQWNGIVLTLNPLGVITGRVTDSAGRPLKGFTVDALTLQQDGRRSLLLAPVKSSATDDRGEYRIYGIEPGAYYVAVSDTTEDPQRRAATEGIFPRTYFPGSSDIKQSRTVAVRDAADTIADFRLARVPTIRIAGKVIGPASIDLQTRQRMDLYLHPRSQTTLQEKPSPGGRSIGRVSLDQTSGTFAIDAIPPGAYDLLAVVSVEPNNRPAQLSDYWTARIPINASDSNIEGLTLTPRLGVPISGRFDVTEVKAPVDVAITENIALPNDMAAYLRQLAGAMGLQVPDRLSSTGNSYGVVRLVPEDWMPPAIARLLSVSADGTGQFSIPEVPEGRYSFSVSSTDVTGIHAPDSLPGTEQVIVGTQPVTGIRIDLNRSERVLVSGTVVDSEKKVVAGATVLLLPDTGTDNPHLHGRAVTDTLGRFRVRTLPGPYRILACLQLTPAMEHDADFQIRYVARGLRITVDSAATQPAEIEPLSCKSRL